MITGIDFDFSNWSAVSLALVIDDSLFFIKRSDEMPSFRGHLAFIGGHRHQGETDPWITAQREFEEETSLDKSLIEFLGYLPVISTVSSRYIAPLVAKVNLDKTEFIKSIKSNGEWTYAFTTPLKKFFKMEDWSYGIGHWRDKVRHVYFHSIPAHLQLSTRRETNNEMLWGATAKMVWTLVQLQKN